MKAIVYGETIWDVYPGESVIGGAAFNFAAHLAHLGDTAYFISAVGKDTLGDAALAESRHHGIRTDLIQQNLHPTGACHVSLDAGGLPSYHVLEHVAYDHIKVDPALIDTIRAIDADVFYFNTLIQREPESRAALKEVLAAYSFKNIVCDINLRQNCFDTESLLFCMEKSTIVKISEEEGHFLYDLGLLTDCNTSYPIAVAKRFPNLQLVVYTLGAEGSVVFDVQTEKMYHAEKPEKVAVVSTVGAGDCYGATFVSKYLAGESIPDAIAAATARSSIVVAHKAAIPF